MGVEGGRFQRGGFTPAASRQAAGCEHGRRRRLARNGRMDHSRRPNELLSIGTITEFATTGALTVAALIAGDVSIKIMSNSV